MPADLAQVLGQRVGTRSRSIGTRSRLGHAATVGTAAGSAQVDWPGKRAKCPSVFPCSPKAASRSSHDDVSVEEAGDQIRDLHVMRRGRKVARVKEVQLGFAQIAKVPP